MPFILMTLSCAVTPTVTVTVGNEEENSLTECLISSKSLDSLECEIEMQINWPL